MIKTNWQNNNSKSLLLLYKQDVITYYFIKLIRGKKQSPIMLPEGTATYKQNERLQKLIMSARKTCIDQGCYVTVVIITSVASHVWSLSLRQCFGHHCRTPTTDDATGAPTTQSVPCTATRHLAMSLLTINSTQCSLKPPELCQRIKSPVQATIAMHIYLLTSGELQQTHLKKHNFCWPKSGSCKLQVLTTHNVYVPLQVCTIWQQFKHVKGF